VVNQDELINPLLEAQFLNFEQNVMDRRGDPRDLAGHRESLGDDTPRVLQPAHGPGSDDKDRSVFLLSWEDVDLLQCKGGHLLVERPAHALVGTKDNDPPTLSGGGLRRDCFGLVPQNDLQPRLDGAVVLRERLYRSFALADAGGGKRLLTRTTA
jgi:hypothetical protein